MITITVIAAKDIPKKITKEEAIKRIMKGLEITQQEAEEVYDWDQLIEKDPTVGILPPEKEAVARKMTHTGTRERKLKRTTVYNLEARKRKPNATKEGLVSELAEYVRSNSSFDVTNLLIANPSQKFSFLIGDKWYTWTLTEHRTKPKWCE